MAIQPLVPNHQKLSKNINEKNFYVFFLITITIIINIIFTVCYTGHNTICLNE